MQLVAWKDDPAEYQSIRNLTPAELLLHEGFKRPFFEAENRLALFRILNLNYKDWTEFLTQLTLNPVSYKGDKRIRLNQLLFNYLTVSYAITEHFEKTYKGKFRNDKPKLSLYNEFLNQLTEECWAFAFFQDFRGHVQHCELPVGEYHKNASQTKVEVKVTQNAEALLKDSRGWKKCKLSSSHGTLDLVVLLHEYHSKMIQSYGTFVAKSFYPQLTEADAFYTKLLHEVQALWKGYRMVFGKSISTPTDRGTTEVNIECWNVPNDLFGEIGIQITKSMERKAATANQQTG